MNTSFDKFNSLPKEKQQRIVNAAFVEFGTKGFRQASTNAIAAQAEIGKGMLFYYFGSKEELFDFLCEYAVAFARAEYIGKLNGDSGDFLDRYAALTDVKRRTMSRMPEFMTFFNSFYKPENAQFLGKFKATIDELRVEIYGKIYDGLDYSLFRGDICGDEVVAYMRWLFEGYERSLESRIASGGLDVSDDKQIAQEWENYYAFVKNLRKIFYKNVGGTCTCE